MNSPLSPVTLLSDTPRIAPPIDKVTLWLKLFADQGVDPLMMVGVKTDGTPVIAAVESLNGEKFGLRQLLTDILLRVGDR